MKSILVAMMLVLPLSAFANEYDREYVEGRDASICDAYANAAAVAVIENGLKTQNITVNAGDVTASKPATGAYTEYPVGSTLGDYYGAHLQVKFGGEYVADVSVMLAYVQNSKDCYATEITPFWKKK